MANYHNAARKVAENNAKYENGQSGHKLALNHLSDQTEEEFLSHNLGFMHNPKRESFLNRAATDAITTTTKATTTTTKPTTTTTRPTTTTTKPTTTTTKPSTTTTKPTTTTTKPTTTITKPTTTTPTTTTKPTTTTTKPTTTTIKPTTTTTKPTTTLPNGLPSSVDWRTVGGAVTPVKNQGHCGSCYSFSVTGAMEGQYYIKHNQSVSLSEQQIVDCGGAFDSSYLLGCNGGNMDSAFEYIQNVNGSDSEASYPYAAVKGSTCKFNSSNVVAKCAGFVDLPSTEAALMQAVATIGPISVSIGVNSNAGLYRSGHFPSSMCASPNNHAVLVVGYETNSTTGPYWIVKNSWGTGWGIAGYMEMPLGVNACGINQTPSYPIIV